MTKEELTAKCEEFIAFMNDHSEELRGCGLSHLFLIWDKENFNDGSVQFVPLELVPALGELAVSNPTLVSIYRMAATMAEEFLRSHPEIREREEKPKTNTNFS